MSKNSLATVWLDGCSGCHMSFLDMDERLVALGAYFDLVYSPLVDLKAYPEHVDFALVEGAISSTDDQAKIRKIRAHTGTLIAMGDCAITANVPSMRNPFTTREITDRAYFENASFHQQLPTVYVPTLLKVVRPIQEFVHVDYYLPGCPPSADTFFAFLTGLVQGHPVDVSSLTRFGA